LRASRTLRLDLVFSQPRELQSDLINKYVEF